ncbi:MAG: hypothetical protein HY326_13375 [Chloroflexi bacterium]|nr:hypothetical protein [Chloroflexota bacterium]
MRIQDIIQWHSQAGQPVTVDERTITPLSQVLVIQLPFAAWVWHRPAAVLVERDGQAQCIPILDMTRLVQVGLWAVIGITAVVIGAGATRRKEQM